MKGFLAGAVSPDGHRWTAIDKHLLAEFVDGDSIAHYDDATGRYVAYLRFHTGGRRTVGRSETTDFRRFNPEKVVLQPDPQDPPDTSFYGPRLHAISRQGRSPSHVPVRVPPQHRQHRPAARREPRRRLLVPARPTPAHSRQRYRGDGRLGADSRRPRPRRSGRRPVGSRVRGERQAAQQRRRLVPAQTRRACAAHGPVRGLAAGPPWRGYAPGTADSSRSGRSANGRRRTARTRSRRRPMACSRRCWTATRRPASFG